MAGRKNGKLRAVKTTEHFLSLPNFPMAQADVLILPVPYEQTVTYKPGTRLGPEGACRQTASCAFTRRRGGWHSQPRHC